MYGYYKDKRMETFFSKTVKVIGAVAAYWFVSISLVFLNKYLLSSRDLKLDAPFFITWFQCFVSVILCFIFSFLAKAMPNVISFPSPKIDPKVMRDVLPLSLIFLLMITFNNLCLKYVGVAFYFVGRSLTTVFNVVFSYLILQQSTSIRAIGCCGLIIFGFVLGVNQEGASGHLSVTGVIFGCVASMTVALNAIYTKKVLPSVNNSVWKLTMYNNINAALLFIPLLFLFGDVKAVFNFPKLNDITFWSAMSISGIFGFGMGYVTGLQIQITSPLTHNVSGTAKACAQTILGCIVYHEIKTMLWWLSNFVVLFGSFLYTLVRRSEMKQSHAKEMGTLAQKIEEGIGAEELSESRPQKT